MTGNGDEGQMDGLAELGNPVCPRRKPWATPRVILSDLRQDTAGAPVSAYQATTAIGKLS